MSIQIDGGKVKFWARKADALKAAKSIGWQAKDVQPVHTRFQAGWAIAIWHMPGEFLSHERFAELSAS